MVETTAHKMVILAFAPLTGDNLAIKFNHPPEYVPLRRREDTRWPNSVKVNQQTDKNTNKY